MIDQAKQLFPYCIVWTIIPCLTWLFPSIGHVGICDSNGVIYDFLGYHVNTTTMAFGRPIKYFRLYPQSTEDYNKSLYQTNQEFEHQAHDLCWYTSQQFSNNCHHHVAAFLNRLKYEGKQNWSQLDIWWMCIRGCYVNYCSILKVYIPIAILAGIIAILVIFV